MPGITYIIRFTHRGSDSGFPYEEQEHISLADAWNAFRLFAEPTAPTCTPKSSWPNTTGRKIPSAASPANLGERYSF